MIFGIEYFVKFVGNMPGHDLPEGRVRHVFDSRDGAVVEQVVGTH